MATKQFIAVFKNSPLSIPLQLHDFSQLNENIFYVYNDIEYFKDEPQKICIMSEEDIHVTEEVYKRPMFTMPTYRLFTLFLYWPFAPPLTRQLKCVWLPAVEYTRRFINSAACLCRGWLPFFFGRKGAVKKVKDCSILFAIRFVASALLRYQLHIFPEQENI